MENAKKFFEETIKTEEAKALIAATKKTETEEDRIAAYIEIAKKLGIELTADEINEYFSSAEKNSAELDDKELAQLVGGVVLSGPEYEHIFRLYSAKCGTLSVIQIYMNTMKNKK